jgi:hypothetical protein
MKVKTPEYIEGAEAWDRFRNAMAKALRLPKAELDRRIAAQRRESSLNPHKRGPKPKSKPSALGRA